MEKLRSWRGVGVYNTSVLGDKSVSTLAAAHGMPRMDERRSALPHQRWMQCHEILG